MIYLAIISLALILGLEWMGIRYRFPIQYEIYIAAVVEMLVNIKCDNCDNTNSTTNSGNLIFTSTIKTPNNTVKYVDVTYSDTPSDTNDTTDQVAPYWSSDPQYEQVYKYNKTI